MAMACPHCGVLMQPELRSTWTQFVWEPSGSGSNRTFGAWSCRSCGRPITGEAQEDQIEGWRPLPGSFFPAADPQPVWPDTAPAEVRQDATAAHRCFAIGEWRASAAMARRALQGGCIDKEADESTLERQIDQLAERQLITPQMRDVAHKIRLGGNAGAHPDKDGLRDVTETHAKALLVFLDDFVRFVYEIPSRLAALGEPSESDGAS